MKILITGNMGYIGPSVVRQLRESFPKAFLVGIDTGYFASCLTNPVIFPEACLDLQYFVDLRRLPENLFSGIDAVVHLAGISNDPIGNAFEKTTMDINYHASVELARRAKDAMVKSFVFASSCSVYGLADDAPRTEESSLNPLTAYAKSKIFFENELKKLADNNFKVTCLRLSTACGMSERLRLDLVLNDFVACAVTSKKISVLSDGTPWRPLIHIRDIARAAEWAIKRKPEESGNFLPINIGSAEWNYQVKDLARTVAEVVPDVEISINRNAPPDKRSYRVSFELFKRLAPKEYQPQVSLKSAIEELYGGLKAMSFDDINFRESNLIRLKVLRNLQDKGLLNENLEWTIK